ncbi:uncharacterized protein LOC113217129 [Frankliniella occidentalis]|uniref:Uncharacterized protein LOC113217129 n=1 Tax=Frankliniella occidentalis TaxID=133901 RepID=A0A6J1THK7_FRAOC|nr:uncharacterized protein LOC113217129 [Frankliniella occidentalis]
MDAKPHPEMRLLHLVEYTARTDTLKKQGECSLAEVKTKDGRASFEPVLRYSKSGGSQPVNRHVVVMGQPPSHMFSNSPQPLYVPAPVLLNHISLSLRKSKTLCATPPIVHCVMVGWPATKKAPQNAATQQQLPQPTSDTSVVSKHVVLDGKSFENVLSLPADTFQRVAVRFMVYDITDVPAPAGVRLCFNQARLKGHLCDSKLVVEGVELPAHRMVLALRSPVLDRMLMTGSFKEAKEGRVELVDFSKSAVEKFLEFLYTDSIKNWGAREVELLLLADKYMVPELREVCSLRLWTCDAPYALKVLHAAGFHEILNRPLRRRLTAIVMDNMETLANSKDWVAFQEAYPVLADSMLGSADRTSDSATCSVWSL